MNWQQRVGETKKGGHADGFQVFGSPGRKWRQEVLPALLETLEGGEGNTGFPPSLYIPTPPEPPKLRHKEADIGTQWEQRPAEFSFPIRQSRIGKNREMDPANTGWVNDL